MPRQAGVESADARRNDKNFGGLLSILESRKDQEESASTSCASSHNRDPL